MSKKQTNTEAVETTPAQFPAVITAENLPATFEALEAADDSDFQEAAEKTYLEFSEGDVVNLAFIGLTEMNFSEGGGESKTKLCAEFSDKDGKEYYNGNAYLVNRLKEIKCPNFVRIVCTGEEKSKSGAGKFKTFKVLYAIK